MATDNHSRDGTQTRRSWMIDEFRQAQQRRQSKARARALEPSKDDSTTGDVDPPDDRGDVDIPRS